MEKISLLDDKQLLSFLEECGEKKYRLGQIHQAVFRDVVSDMAQMSTLPLPLREKLQERFCLSTLEMEKDLLSTDGTNKVLFRTKDNLAIESVLMRHGNSRLTLCVSSQVGCPVKCVFCSTGTMGYTRNLDFWEIVDQVMYFNRKLVASGERVRNIVFMGMGEPLLNFDNVLEAIRIMNDQKKLEIGIRHITISTSGIIPQIKKLMELDLGVNLAVSLHAPNETLRTAIMPINRGYPLEQLMPVLKEYSDHTGKRIFYEYVMLRGKNDKPIHAEELGHLLKGTMAHVNLIPFNPGGSIEDLTCSSRKDILAFQAIVQKHDIPCTVRVTLGQDIDAACGQLVVKKEKEKSEES